MAASSIMIVDDDEGILRRLLAAFSVADFDVHSASDGEMALRRFNTIRPDVVLIDIVMPNREGIETIMAMRKARPETTIIAMSGGGLIASCEYLSLARHLGADAVIPKPFRLADAVALVSRTLDAAPRPQLQAQA